MIIVKIGTSLKRSFCALAQRSPLKVIIILLVQESAKKVSKAESFFPEVCSRHKFGLLGTIDLRQKLNDKGPDVIF
jgi:hypothetical protein